MQLFQRNYLTQFNALCEANNIESRLRLSDKSGSHRFPAKVSEFGEKHLARQAEKRAIPDR